MGKNFGVIAENVAAFLKSPIVDFLGKLISNTVILGLEALAGALDFVAQVFQKVIDVIDAFNGKSVKAVNIPNPLGGGYTADNRTYDLPKFAEGGIVMPRAGGTMGIIGEAGQAEAVIPLDRLDRYTNSGSSNFNITVNAGMGSDGGRIGQLIVDEIVRYERSSGRVFARA